MGKARLAERAGQLFQKETEAPELRVVASQKGQSAFESRAYRLDQARHRRQIAATLLAAACQEGLRLPVVENEARQPRHEELRPTLANEGELAGGKRPTMLPAHQTNEGSEAVRDNWPAGEAVAVVSAFGVGGTARDRDCL